MEINHPDSHANNAANLQLKFNLAVITRLTSQADSLSLTDTMINTLLSVPAIMSVAIYEVHHTRGNSVSNIADTNHLSVRLLREKPWLADDDRKIPDLLYESVLKKTHCIETDKTVFISIPVLPAEGPLGHVLHIELKDESTWHQLLKGTQAMFEVFGNMLKLFDKLERDTLTGFFNGNSLEKSLHQYSIQAVKSAKEANRTAKNVWLAAIRVAQIQSVVNDRGQQHADEILLKFSYFLEHSFRDTDLFFRRSVGDFYVLLPCDDEPGARVALDRLIINHVGETSNPLAEYELHIVYTPIETSQPAMTQLGELYQALNKLSTVSKQSAVQSIKDIRKQALVEKTA